MIEIGWNPRLVRAQVRGREHNESLFLFFYFIIFIFKFFIGQWKSSNLADDLIIFQGTHAAGVSESGMLYLSKLTISFSRDGSDIT